MALPISFSKFDSAAFPLMEQSIEHARDNPFLLDRFCDKFSTTRDGQGVLVSEPSSILSSLIWMLDPYLSVETFPADEIYMPEKTSKRLYNSHDFWYVCMMVNDCPSVTEYDFRTLRYLPAKELNRIEVFLRNVKGQVNVYLDEENIIYR